MAKKKQVGLPRTGGGGLVTYYDEMKGKILITPQQMLIFIGIVTTIVVVLKNVYLF
jgi:preprotein translocase subunit Sec61beta